MADLKTQAKSRVKSARTASTAAKKPSSSSGGSKLKTAAKARPKPQFKLMGAQEEWLEDEKRRRDPEYMPPLPPDTTNPIPPGPKDLENPVAPIDPYLTSFAKIPGLRKRSGVNTG